MPAEPYSEEHYAEIKETYRNDSLAYTPIFP